MKIAIDARMYGPEQCSGIGVYIQKLTEQLFKIDSKNQYILFLREPEFSRFQPPHEGVKKIKVTPRWYSYAEQLVLPFQFAKESFDLIHYPHFNSPILFPKKSICTIHDLTPLFFPGPKMNSPLRRASHKLVRWSTLHKASKIIAVSENTKQDIIKYFHIPREKITVTYEGVDERFRIIQNNAIINQTKERFGIRKPYIFFVGVWRDHKNVEGLVRAFNFLKKKYHLEHQLVLAGRPDLHYTNIQKQIAQSLYKKDIVTPGFIPDADLPTLYNGAELLAIPSFIEGFGLIAIEAQSGGCPIASSNTTSLPEILQDSALFFDPRKDKEMAEAIYKIISQPEIKAQLVRRGLENAKRFRWEKCAEQTLKIYESLA